MAVGRLGGEPDSPADLTELLSRAPGQQESRADRERLADEWIGQRLREIGYDLAHPECQQLADHLYALGVGTLINLLGSGRLFHKCRELGLRGLPLPPASWAGEARRVIVVAVRLAIPRFITGSMPKWDSMLSSIATYFINYCLFQFKAAYLEYCKEESQALNEVPVDNINELFEARSSRVTVEDRAIARQTVREAVRLVGCEEFALFARLSASGQTRAEIAATMGISLSTLDRRIRRYRQQLEFGGWPREAVTGSND